MISDVAILNSKYTSYFDRFIDPYLTLASYQRCGVVDEA
jgi:hypothetical protein